MKVLKQIQVPSQSQPNKFYTVRKVEEDGIKKWLCNCPAFLFKNNEQIPCKHILKVTK